MAVEALSNIQAQIAMQLGLVRSEVVRYCEYIGE